MGRRWEREILEGAVLKRAGVGERDQEGDVGCYGIFVHCVRVYFCDWCNKKLNGQ